jgi:hypothetical protein
VVRKSKTAWSTLEGQAVIDNTVDLIGRGTLKGQLHGILYNAVLNQYTTDTTGLGPFTRAQITSLIQAGDTMTIMGVPPGTGTP